MFNGMGGGWGMGFGGPFMILFWIVVIVGVVMLVKWLVDQSSSGKGSRDKSPLEILRERYARGEITAKSTSRRSATSSHLCEGLQQATTTRHGRPVKTMCELFGMSASGPTRAASLLGEFRLRGGLTADNPDGWGLSYWDGSGFHIFKAPEPAARSACFGELCDTVRSRVVVAHVRKARHPPINTMTNTHPFTRICCGREWVFAHNGLVPGVVELELARQNPICRPTGETDSEHAFCHVLAHLAEAFGAARGHRHRAWMSALAAESELLTSFGKFNFLMSDGDNLIAYGHDRLHYTEAHSAQASNGKRIHSVVIATEPLNAAEGWIAFKPGELRVYRSGRLAGRMMTRPAPTLQVPEDRPPELKSASLVATPMHGVNTH